MSKLILFKLLFAILVAVNTNLQHVEGQAVFTSKGVVDACDWRYADAVWFSTCAQPPKPEIRDDTDFFRVITVLAAFEESKCNLRSENYVCRNLKRYYEDHSQAALGYARQSLAAETFLYGNYYLIGRDSYNTSYLQGKFGPLFVRAKWHGVPERWADTHKIPGYLKRESIYPFYRYFIPRIDKVNNPYLKIWVDAEPAKKDFAISISLSVTCQDEDKRCETIPSDQDSKHMHSFAPQSSETLKPTINTAVLSTTTFTLTLNNWGNRPREIEFYNKLNDNVFTTQCLPMVLFVLYDSNPLPHGNPDGTSIYEARNGQIRAVFNTWTQLVGKWVDGQGQKRLDMIWDLAWDPNMENKFTFLAEWQSRITNEQDKMWYKGWNKTTGMSVAFSFCSCEGGFERKNGCMEYIHSTVSIIDRPSLQ